MILFYLFAAVAVVASLLVIAQRNPIYSVLYLIASFGALSALYVLLEAPFVAMIQIIVYAGAIMVLFLFVVMLLNAPREDVPTAYGPSLVSLTVGARKRFALLAVVLVGELIWAITRFAMPAPTTTNEEAGQVVSSVRAIGIALFTDHAFAFEVTSVLILGAMVGAVVLARKQA
jgi:NADH-quinone oxidoreductase subunit J